MKKISIRTIVLNFLWPSVFAISLSPDSPYVRIPLGEIKGFYKISAENRQYAAFESIPYAQPPVGKLRFEPPVSIKPWSKKIEALSLPPACLQYDNLRKILQGTEDCLYLNIYVPVTNKLALPVIFWIHGGGFQFGTSSNYGAMYLMDRDVILVTINYRVGPLGFLSTGDDIVPGNMGLKDQVLALKWVSENIKYFGGDPKKISLMGVSAGGASVHYHYLSPLSRGLFRNGVSFSGSALATWAFTPNATKIAKTFAKSVKCPVDNSSSMVQCLREMSVDSIINATAELSVNLYFTTAPFPPVIERTSRNYFINDSPKNILEKGNVYDVPWITGIVEMDGLFMTSGFMLNKTLVEYTDKHWEKIGPILLVLNNRFSSNEQTILANKAREHYFGSELFTTELASAKKLTSLVGDGIIAAGSISSAKWQAKVVKSPVRFYYYTYRASQSLSDGLSCSRINFGVSHDDDTYLVLENKYINPTTTEKDKAMLQDMLNYWYSIANDDYPDLGTSWPPVNLDSSELHYMHIRGPKNYTMESSDNLKEVLFWKKNGI